MDEVENRRESVVSGPEQSNEVDDSLDGYIENISDEEIPVLVGNRETFRLFCEKLVSIFEPLERREAAFERLLEVVNRLSLRSDYLLQTIEAWLPKRQNLVSTIKEDAKTMNIMTKACNTGRLVTAAIDSAGMIIGGSNGRHAIAALHAASICRMIGFAASAAELFNWKSTLERLMKLIQTDQAAFAPIQAFFYQNNELELALKAIFPFEISRRIVKEFEKVVHDDLSQSQLLQVILGPLLMEDANRLRDIVLIRNLVALTRCPAATNWCRWIMLRRHKVSLDIETMLLQMINPQRIVSSQSVGMLAKGAEQPPPLVILARIGLNCVTVYDAFQALKHGGMVEELQQLQKHLQMEMTAVVQIARLLQIRRNDR